MKTQRIYITAEDMERLRAFLRMATSQYDKDRAHLMVLSGELDRAEVVPPDQVPSNVVTMNSHALLRDVASDEKMDCIVVFPEDANSMAGKISVVAPIGAAILGRKVGDEICVKVPTGLRRLRIERLLYQPEATAIKETRKTSTHRGVKRLARAGPTNTQGLQSIH